MKINATTSAYLERVIGQAANALRGSPLYYDMHEIYLNWGTTGAQLDGLVKIKVREGKAVPVAEAEQATAINPAP